MMDKLKKSEKFRAFVWSSVIFVRPRMTSQQMLRMRIDTIDHLTTKWRRLHSGLFYCDFLHNSCQIKHFSSEYIVRIDPT